MSLSSICFLGFSSRSVFMAPLSDNRHSSSGWDRQNVKYNGKKRQWNKITMVKKKMSTLESAREPKRRGFFSAPEEKTPLKYLYRVNQNNVCTHTRKRKTCMKISIPNLFGRHKIERWCLKKCIIEIFMHVFLLLMCASIILADCIYIYITMHIAPLSND